MRIGFLGAGKAGFTLGKYFSTKGAEVIGYWSRSSESAMEAADFTNSTYYDSIERIVQDSDTLFLTVPDSAIGTLWDSIKNFPLKDKLVCHVSGAFSSGVFSDIDRTGAFGFSIHPLFAINSKYNSYKQLNKAFFTVEGAEEKISLFRTLFGILGNNYAIISADKKELYHAAAVMASNDVIALLHTAEESLISCGFTPMQSAMALKPLFMGNAENLCEYGTVKALTGPVERNDISTMKGHLACLKDDDRHLYTLLSLKLCEVAEKKYGINSRQKMREYLREELQK